MFLWENVVKIIPLQMKCEISIGYTTLFHKPLYDLAPEMLKSWSSVVSFLHLMNADGIR